MRRILAVEDSGKGTRHFEPFMDYFDRDPVCLQLREILRPVLEDNDGYYSAKGGKKDAREIVKLLNIAGFRHTMLEYDEISEGFKLWVYVEEVTNEN